MSDRPKDSSRLAGPSGAKLRHRLARTLFQAPAVLAVGFSPGQEALQIWSVVDPWNDETVEPVYALELKLIRRFRRLRFDFYTVATRGTSVETAFDRRPGDLIVRPHA